MTAADRGAQHGEDHELVRRFDGLRDGFFVEVGALDGVTFSNTLHLEEALGWRGILVEALPDQARLCHGNRPGSRVAAVAVTDPDSAGTPLVIRSVRGYEALSTVEFSDPALEILQRERASGRDLDIEEVRVETSTIDAVLSGLGCPDDFELLSIDIEGHELRALAGCSLGVRWRPTVVLVENNDWRPERALVRLLGAAGYRYVRTIGGINEWYERLDEPALRSRARHYRDYRGQLVRGSAKALLGRLGLLDAVRRVRRG